MHWGKILADKVLDNFGDQDIYTTAAGISPSGIIHFGNLRDIITAYVVSEALKAKGKKARLIFSWDDFDRFRKVPANIDPSFEQYIGLPLVDVPCPDGKYSSYAHKFESEFEKSLLTMGIETEYRYQSQKYRAGDYDQMIIDNMRSRLKIADILLSMMSDKAKAAKNIDIKQYRENYYPISIYSRFSGKDKTKVLSYDDGSKVTYLCLETNKQDTIDLKKDRVVKLGWKVDWPMRWGYEGVVFEPGGHDHASPGSSFDTSSRIAKEAMGLTPPLLQEYKFVGLQGLGAKMSGSKGGAVSPSELLDIYTPEMLKWLYIGKAPNQSFELSFGKEIFRQYNDFDQAILEFKEAKTADDIRDFTISLAGANHIDGSKQVSFRQLLGLGQIVSWDLDKLMEVLDKVDIKYDPKSLKARMARVRNWLDKYNQQEKIVLMDSVNKEYVTGLSIRARNDVLHLRDYLAQNQSASMIEIEELLYAIPKTDGLSEQELKGAQKQFFVDVYNLLINKDAGPRLATFLWAADRGKILSCLSID